MGNHFFFFTLKWAIIQNSYKGVVIDLNKKRIKDVIEFLIVCMGVTFVFRFAIMPIKVDGSSMYPTLQDHDYAFMSRIDLNHIERFDIVT